MDLILASSSAYRRALLERLPVPFAAHAPAVDETPQPGETPPELAARLARSKAQAAQCPGAVVIGSDQVAALDGRIIGKPGEHQAALQQLLACQGREVVFLTAVALSVDDGRDCLQHLDTTRVKFRSLPETTLDRYLLREQPYDCAGSFKAEGEGITLFESIQSEDPTALLGLPLIWLSGQLRTLGLLN